MLTMHARAAGISDIGRCRKVNQDMYLVDDALGLYAIADGMGGHAAGEVASDIAISALATSLRGRESSDGAWSPSEAGDVLCEAFREGNRKICESVLARAEWRGMGTTIVALMRVRDRAVVAHVGDSRAYLLRDGRLRRLTDDHSWVSEQVKHGLLTPEQAGRHPMRNIVTRALGNQPEVEVDLAEEEIRPGDVFALCSDGLNGMLGDDEIQQVLEANASVPQEACRRLVDRANALGGEDNITVIVVRLDD
jgi:protein phosphatase